MLPSSLILTLTRYAFLYIAIIPHSYMSLDFDSYFSMLVLCPL
jgi:hypothetical protein